MKKFLEIFLGIIILYLYFKIFACIFYLLPFNELTTVIGIFVLIIIVIPLSVITTHLVLKVLKKNND